MSVRCERRHRYRLALAAGDRRARLGFAALDKQKLGHCLMTRFKSIVDLRAAVAWRIPSEVS